MNDTKGSHGTKSKTSKSKGKEKAADRTFIPIPVRGDDEYELSDDDLQALEEYGNALSFLHTLDEKGIARYVEANLCI